MSENTRPPPTSQEAPASQVRRAGLPRANPDVSYAAVASGRLSPSCQVLQPQSNVPPPCSPPRSRYLGEIPTSQTEFYQLQFPRLGEAHPSSMFGSSNHSSTMLSGAHTAQTPIALLPAQSVAHSPHYPSDSPRWDAQSQLSVEDHCSAQSFQPDTSPELPSWPASHTRIRPRPRPIPLSSELASDDNFFTRRPHISLTATQAAPLPHAQPSVPSQPQEYIFVHSQTPAQPYRQSPSVLSSPMAPPGPRAPPFAAQPPPASPGSVLDLSYSTGDEFTILSDRQTTPQLIAPAPSGSTTATKGKSVAKPSDGPNDKPTMAGDASGLAKAAKGKAKGRARAKASGKAKAKGKGKTKEDTSGSKSDATTRPKKKPRTKKAAKPGETLETVTAKQHAEAALGLNDSDAETRGASDLESDEDNELTGSGRWGHHKFTLHEWWYDPEDYEYHKSNQGASHKDASTLLFQGKFNPKQVKDCLDSVLRLYKTYKRFVKRSGTARPNEDEEKEIRGVLAANGVRYSYEQLIRFGKSNIFEVMDRVLHHRPEIQKIINNDPAHDITDDEDDTEDKEDEDSKKGKSNKRAHTPEEQCEHLHRMEIVMSESVQLLASRTRISERELDIATRREDREAQTQQTQVDLEARQS
ncbi:hypothetical protein FRC12_002566 [Ceratobasidium sp. 428]|nr:hypothetical protein FRC12_002566 [Ceratobasidium sp. 428]